MNNKKLKLLTLSTVFALSGCQFSIVDSSSNSGTSNPSSSVTLKEYTVTWVVDGENTQETYLEGEMPVYKYGTEKEADSVYTYTFVGWDKELVPVVADVTYTAMYEKEFVEYVVTWVVDGVSENETYHYEEMPEYKGNPSKEGNAQYSYTFTGWDKELVKVTENTTYTAVFEAKVNEYTITWVVDGESTKETYEYGETPAYPGETPTKEADAQYTYTFAGWDNEIVPVEGDATYTAVFNNSVNTYTVTWIAGSGEEVTEEYEYGETPEFKGSTDRESVKYTYTFTGWEPKIAPVTSDITYVAQYDETINKFPVKFYNEDGTLLETVEVEYDAAPVYTGETPSKASEGEFNFVFTGWENRETGLIYSGELPTIIGPAEYYAKYDAVGKPYELTYNLYNVDGSLIKSEKTEFGYHSVYTLNAPEIDGKVANKDYVRGYMEPNAETVNFYYSDLDVYDGTSVSTSLAGEGTEENPYLISSGADLAYIRDQINNSTKEAPVTFAGKYFKLTKSIDLNDTENFSIGYYYDLGKDADGVAIKNHRNETIDYVAFAGHLDGNNCSIRGININQTTPYGALFAALLETGTIKNLSSYGVVNGNQYTGGIVGRSFGKLLDLTNYVKLTQAGANGGGGVVGGTFKGSLTDGCVNYGKIECTTANNKTAGVAGLGEGVITNCVNFADINGNSLVGGVIGESLANQELVDNCVNYGNITVKQCGGGVVGQSSCLVVKNLTNYGYVKSTSTGDAGTHFAGGVVGCVKYGEYTNLVNYATIDGSARIGGVTGQVDSTKTTAFDGCVNYGKVISNHKTNSYGGGVFGCIKAATVTNCVNNGEVVGVGYFLAGILGVIATSGDVKITACINNGNVTCKANGVGGILGGPVNVSKSNMTISGCTNNGTITGGQKVAGIVGIVGAKGTIGDDNVNNGTVVSTANLYVGEIIGIDNRK